MTDIQNISLDLVDNPGIAMRSQHGEAGLDELASSIREIGIMQPVTLRAKAGRYEIIAGHRRCRAAKLAGLATVPAVLLEATDEDTERLKIHENLYREDINPVDEARYVCALIDKFGYTPDQMAKLFHKSREYVQSRFELMQYPDYLRDAVEQDKIGLTAAKWLFSITDERTRHDYTNFAVIGGITAKRAEAWFQSWKAGQAPADPTAIALASSSVPGEIPKLVAPCILCGSPDELTCFEMHYVHPACLQHIRH